MTLALDEGDLATLNGEQGPAAQHAMRILVGYGEVTGATHFIDVTSAHIDACLHHGLAGVEFAELLRDLGGRVGVPATLNVSSLDLLHPNLFRGDDEVRDEARRMMDAYLEMGCQPTWTCAPYQLPTRPALGEHVAWAESNAIVFANSVLGARTGRYGDFFDIAAALVGRVPFEGLHTDEGRRASVTFDLSRLPDQVLSSEVLYPLLGHLIGETTNGIPAIVGLLEETDEDSLKALGAAAASAGSVAMFHAVGITPEAPDLEAATDGMTPSETVMVDVAMLRDAFDELDTGIESPLVGVSVGTPHFSLDELRATVRLLDGRSVHPKIDFFASTSRDIYRTAEREGLVGVLEGAGVELVVDTCTYVTPILRNLAGSVMTNSAKWAYYAPGNIGVDVAFGSLSECVESAIAGNVVRDHGLWAHV